MCAYTAKLAQIDEHVKTPDECVAKIAQEYGIKRLQTQEGLDEYFGRAPGGGEMDLTKASGLTPEEVIQIRELRESWGETAAGPDGKPHPFGAQGKKKRPVPPMNKLSPAPKKSAWLMFFGHMASGFALLLEVGGLLCFFAFYMDSLQ